MTDSGNSPLVLVRYVSTQFHEFTRNKKRIATGGRERWKGQKEKKKIKRKKKVQIALQSEEFCMPVRGINHKPFQLPSLSNLMLFFTIYRYQSDQR